MPPKKKTEKAIAAEIKKKNTAAAEEILEKLKEEARKTLFTPDVVSTVKSTTAANSETVDKRVEMPTKKRTEKVEVKRKISVDAEQIIAKSKRISKKTINMQDVAPKTTVVNSVTVETTVNSTETGKSNETGKNKKKTKKDIAAEIKKKNTAAAEEILEKLKEEARKTLFSPDVVSPDVVSTVEKREKIPTRKRTEKVERKKKITVDANQIVAKPKRMSKKKIDMQDATPKTTMVNSVTVETTVNSTETRKSGNFDVADQVTKVPIASERTKPVQIVAVNTNISKIGNSAAIAPTKTAAYHYEIDCVRVADSINVIDLQKFIEKKLNGKVNNLGNTITICCDGHKVVVESKEYLPKKSLRFLSKKFLKKMWNIQVVSKNSHSYEYKYIGTQ